MDAGLRALCETDADLAAAARAAGRPEERMVQSRDDSPLSRGRRLYGLEEWQAERFRRHDGTPMSFARRGGHGARRSGGGDRDPRPAAAQPKL
jgi:hypothetical protein